MKASVRDELEYTNQVFYEQFANNQNHHQTLFIQIGSSIVAAVGGYAYIFLRTIEIKNPLPDYWPLLFALIVSLLVLNLGTAITTSMALGFRRDQLVSCKIRAIDGTLEGFGKNIFPSSFNPIKYVNAKLLEWMPNYNLAFWIVLLLLQISLCGSMIWYVLSRSLGINRLYVVAGVTIANLLCNIWNLLAIRAKLKNFLRKNKKWFRDQLNA